MTKKLDDVMAALPAARRAKIERRAQELASMKDLRQAVEWRRYTDAVQQLPRLSRIKHRRPARLRGMSICDKGHLSYIYTSRARDRDRTPHWPIESINNISILLMRR